MDRIIYGIKKIFNNNGWLYKTNISYLSCKLFLCCNSFKAYAWLYQLTEEIYHFDENRVGDLDYCLYCKYSHDEFEKVAQILQSYDFVDIKSHHKERALMYEYQNKKIILMKKSGGIVLIDSNNIYVLVDDLYKNSHVELSRYVREIITRVVEEDDFYIMHAAAVEKNGEVIVIAGDKGAGKTTMLLSLMENGYNIISNDRIFLGIREENLFCYAWPGAVAISVDAIYKGMIDVQVIKNLNNMIYPQQRIRDLKKFIENPNCYAQEFSEDKFDLSCRELANLKGVQFISKGKVKKIVIISVNEVTTKKSENFFLYPEDPSYPNWLQLKKNSNEGEKGIVYVKEMANNFSCTVELKHDKNDLDIIKSFLS